MADINKIEVNNINYNIVGFTKYSTEEQIIGTWINNKPLYRKTLEITIPENTLNSDQGIFNLSELNIENMVNLHGILNAKNFIQIPFYYGLSSPAQFCSLYYNSRTGELRYATNQNQYVNVPLYVTLEYTKTTDVEGV